LNKPVILDRYSAETAIDRGFSHLLLTLFN